VKDIGITAALALAFVALPGVAALSVKASQLNANTQRFPRFEDILALEAALPSDPCVNQSAGWERRYFFLGRAPTEHGQRQMLQGTTSIEMVRDPDVIVFDYREAGFAEFKLRRRILDREPDGYFGIDDRGYAGMGGVYRISTARFSWERRGNLRYRPHDPLIPQKRLG
jgi:hypothetical protein